MTNALLARHFRELATLMEYFGENRFKYQSYSKAADLLKKANQDISTLTREELVTLPGIGDAIASKILEIVDSGQLALLERYRVETPEVARELLGVKGLGPAKVHQLVTELELKSLGDLLHAIEENRVVRLKGFSTATQEKLRQQLLFYQRSLGQIRLPEILLTTAALVAELGAAGLEAEPAGAAVRHSPTTGEIGALVRGREGVAAVLMGLGFQAVDDSPTGLTALPDVTDFTREQDALRQRVRVAPPERYNLAELMFNSAPGFLDIHPELLLQTDAADVETVFAKAGLPYAPAPQREVESPWPPVALTDCVQVAQIGGVVHAHTTYSDGSAELAALASAARDAGFGYLTITDHSRAAGYAHGLDPTRLAAQGREIEAWNVANPDFLVIAGTECDIMRDGSLDFADEVLATLDCVIASVHSVLQMSREDATARLLSAIENPYVTMLGHPTGRLLLSRAGYGLDVEQILAACAKNHVAVEINANPMRLDLDWTHVPLAVELGVKISINPDAHGIGGLEDIKYGVLVAQKAGLRPQDCLNCLSASDFLSYLREQRRRRLAAR